MDIYKIGMTLSMTNGVSGVLGIILADMGRLHGMQGKIQKGFENWKPAIMAAGAAIVGGELLKGMKDLADHGKKLLDQQDQMQRAGESLNDTLKIQAEYFNKIAKSVPTSTAAEYMQTVRELRTVAGTTEGAMAAAPKAMKVDALLSNTFHTKMHGEYYKLLRSAEMKGISTDEAKREQFTDQFFSYITAFGGKLKTDDVQQLARRGGSAFMNASPESLGPIAVTAADIGGSAAGTSLMTFYNQIMGAQTLSKQQGDALADLGLLDMDKVKKTGLGGSKYQVGVGGVKGSLEHMGDMPGMVRDVLWPAIMKWAGGDKAKAATMLAKIAPNRNSAKMAQMFGDEGFLDQQRKDLGLAGQVLPIDEAYKQYTSRNPEGVEKGFSDQFQSMMSAIGAPIMQAALPAMKGVTELFTKIGEIANAHPEAVKVIGEALAGLAAGLLVIGGAGVIAAAAFLVPGGAVALAVAALGGMITAIVAYNWDGLVTGLKTAFDGITTAIEGFVSKLGGLWQKFKDYFSQGYVPTSYEGGGGAGGMIHRASFGGSATSPGGGTSWNGSSVYDSIIRAEGTGKYGDPYNTGLNYAKGSKPLTEMTMDEAMAFGAAHRWHNSTAKGAFQIVNQTQRAAMAALGIKGSDRFSTENQRRMADWVLQHQGLGAWEGFKSHPEERAKARGILKNGVPPAPHEKQDVHMQNVMLLDGEVVHRSVVRRSLKNSEHPTQAPYHNAYAYYTPPDMQHAAG